jgi:hypothetical protein
MSSRRTVFGAANASAFLGSLLRLVLDKNAKDGRGSCAGGGPLRQEAKSLGICGKDVKTMADGPEER